MFKTSEKLASGRFTPKHGLARLPDVKVSRSIAKAISWRTLGTLDTFILSFALISYIGPFLGLKPEKAEALETAGLIAITEVVTKMVFYSFHERAWAKVAWGVYNVDGKRIIGHRRSFMKTSTWRIIASTDTIALAWFYTGSLATALSIGGLYKAYSLFSA